jgi:hypothetical protein
MLLTLAAAVIIAYTFELGRLRLILPPQFWLGAVSVKLTLK